MRDVGRFLDQIGGKKIFDETKDSIRWMETKNDLIFVKSMYEVLEQRLLNPFPCVHGTIVCNLSYHSLLGRPHGQRS